MCFGHRACSAAYKKGLGVQVPSGLGASSWMACAAGWLTSPLCSASVKKAHFQAHELSLSVDLSHAYPSLGTLSPTFAHPLCRSPIKMVLQSCRQQQACPSTLAVRSLYYIHVIIYNRLSCSLLTLKVLKRINPMKPISPNPRQQGKIPT